MYLVKSHRIPSWWMLSWAWVNLLCQQIALLLDDLVNMVSIKIVLTCLCHCFINFSFTWKLNSSVLTFQRELQSWGQALLSWRNLPLPDSSKAHWQHPSHCQCCTWWKASPRLVVWCSHLHPSGRLWCSSVAWRSTMGSELSLQSMGLNENWSSWLSSPLTQRQT